MKNISLLLAFIVVLASCKDKKNQKTDSSSLKSDTLVLVDKATEFLNLFKNIDPQGLHIYPISWDTNGKLNKTPFEGVVIDVHKFPYTDNSSIFLNIKECKEGLSHIYAIGKFNISDKYYGLITRQYSEYYESLIQLMLWDKKQNKIIHGLDLADSFGDAGWYFDFESWIKNFQYNGVLEIVSRRKDFIPKEDFTSEQDMDSITTDTLKISRLSNSKFTTQLGNQQDTVQYKLRNWE